MKLLCSAAMEENHHKAELETAREKFEELIEALASALARRDVKEGVEIRFADYQEYDSEETKT